MMDKKLLTKSKTAIKLGEREKREDERIREMLEEKRKERIVEE